LKCQGLFQPAPALRLFLKKVICEQSVLMNTSGAILKQALSDCLRDQRAALAQLADAARQVDKAAFGSTADFGPAHQALLKALDRAEVLLQG